MIRKFFENARDRAIGRGLSQGNPASVDGLFRAYADRLFAYALSLGLKSQDGEEALQNVFLRIAANPVSLGSVQNLKAYLYRAVRNESINLKKKGAREEPAGERLLEKAGNGGPPGREALEDALGQLSPVLREVVVLKFYQGMSFREIAGILDIPPDTAASRYRYALDGLRKHMGVKRDAGRN